MLKGLANRLVLNGFDLGLRSCDTIQIDGRGRPVASPNCIPKRGSYSRAPDVIMGDDCSTELGGPASLPWDASAGVVSIYITERKLSI